MVRVAETEPEIRESIYISVFPVVGLETFIAGYSDIDKSVTSKSRYGGAGMGFLVLPAEHRNVATRHYKTTPYQGRKSLGELSQKCVRP